jgi:hypothetical protein
LHWASLGIYDFGVTTPTAVITVRLSNAANGKVVADGIIAVPVGSPELVTGGPIDPDATTPTLTPDSLQLVVAEARARWAASLTNPADRDALARVEFQVADLPGSTLGLTSLNTIWLDPNAGGHGWFTDPTPWDDVEFPILVADHELFADGDSPAVGRVDLLTVVMHELGHVLGLEDLDPDAHADDLMAATLAPGTRRVFTLSPSAILEEGSATPVPTEAMPDNEGLPLGDSSERQEDLGFLLENLGRRERKVLELRFGPSGNGTHSLRRIGRRLHISTARLRQIQSRALEQLRELVERTLVR